MTKRQIVIHASWAVVAFGAYALGGWRDAEPAAGALKEPSVPGGSAPVAGIPLAGTPSSGGQMADVTESAGAGSLLRSNSTSWQALARDALKDPNPITRRLAFARLLDAMTPENALAIRGELVASGIGRDEWRDFNYHWGALAGKEAVDFAAASEERDLGASLGGWASANPSEAMDFLNNLPDAMQGDRDSLAASIVAGLADRDPKMASDFVFEFAQEGSEGGERLMGMVAEKSLRTSGVADVARWSETLPDGALKASAMDRVARDYVREDPEAAARWAERFADQDYAARVIEEVGDGWGRRDPPAAVQWLENLPEGGGQVAGLTSVFSDWEDSDPLEASKHLANMPPSAKRDSAISGFSRGYAWQNPEAALVWAQDISDPSLRQETITEAGRAYFRREPDSALQWLETSGLPAESIQRIVEPDRRGRRR